MELWKFLFINKIIIGNLCFTFCTLLIYFLPCTYVRKVRGDRDYLKWKMKYEQNQLNKIWKRSKNLVKKMNNYMEHDKKSDKNLS